MLPRVGASLSPGARSLLAAIVLAVAPLVLSSCGGSRDDDSLPPLTPEPSLSLPPAVSSPPAVETVPPASRSATRASYPARLTLVRFLRGAGSGDQRVCALVTAAYARTAFAEAGGCQQWIDAIPTRLTPNELRRLRTVQVLGATPGPRPGQYTIRPADLRWSGGASAPEGVVAQRYVLARAGTRWLVIA